MNIVSIEDKEVLIKLSYSEIDLLKGAIAKYTGDRDDPEQIELGENLKSLLLQCKGMLKPS